MGGLFKGIFGGDTPSVSPPPPPPTDNSAEVEAARQAERQRRAAAGRASTVLAGDTEGEPDTARKKLLGA